MTRSCQWTAWCCTDSATTRPSPHSSASAPGPSSYSAQGGPDPGTVLSLTLYISLFISLSLSFFLLSVCLTDLFSLSLVIHSNELCQFQVVYPKIPVMWGHTGHNLRRMTNFEVKLYPRQKRFYYVDDIKCYKRATMSWNQVIKVKTVKRTEISHQIKSRIWSSINWAEEFISKTCNWTFL